MKGTARRAPRTMPSPSPAVLLPCTSSCSASNLLLLHACSGQWCYWQIPQIRSNAESALLHLNACFLFLFSQIAAQSSSIPVYYMCGLYVWVHKELFHIIQDNPFSCSQNIWFPNRIKWKRNDSSININDSISWDGLQNRNRIWGILVWAQHLWM